MPVSKKPRRTAMPGSSRKVAAPGVVTDRRAMKSFLSTITGRSRREAIEKAQDVIYDAWGAHNGPLPDSAGPQGARHYAAVRGRL
jgi:hypothetical protein